MMYRDILQELEMDFTRMADVGQVKVQREVIEQYCDDVRQHLHEAFTGALSAGAAEPWLSRNQAEHFFNIQAAAAFSDCL